MADTPDFESAPTDGTIPEVHAEASGAGGGRHVERPQAERLPAGLQDVRHVIADAAYDARPPRAFNADDLGASARIKTHPSRCRTPPADWRLRGDRHQIERFHYDSHDRLHRHPAPFVDACNDTRRLEILRGPTPCVFIKARTKPPNGFGLDPSRLVKGPCI